MKKWTRFLIYFLLFWIGVAGIFWAMGYGFLGSGIAKTYLRGQTSATIDDGTLFPSNTVETGIPRLLPVHPDKVSLPATLEKSLNESKTASLLVIKNGTIVFERYWPGHTPKDRTNSFSMAKAVTVMLMGVAIQEGKIKSLDQAFSDFYPAPAGLTLRHLARMESGLDWNEEYKNPFGPNARAYYGDDLAKATLETRYKAKPGTEFEYQSGTSQLLGFAVQKAVGTTLANYLSQKIWKPLGMESPAEWNTDKQGMEKSFCCLNAQSRDFAKLGVLLAQDGVWNGERLLPAGFAKEMATPTSLSRGSYGMGLWINDTHPIPHQYFWGFLGQYIVLVPGKNLVIVRTGNYQDQPVDSLGRPTQVAELVEQLSPLFR